MTSEFKQGKTIKLNQISKKLSFTFKKLNNIWLIFFVLSAFTSCSTVGTFNNYQSENIAGKVEILKAKKLSEENAAFSLYLINDGSIAIYRRGTTYSYGLDQLQEITKSAIIPKREIPAFKDTLTKIVEEMHKKNKKDSISIDYFLIENQETSVVTTATTSVGKSTASLITKTESGLPVILRLQYKFSIGKMKNIEEIVFYNARVPYINIQRIKIEEIEDLLATIDKL